MSVTRTVVFQTSIVIFFFFTIRSFGSVHCHVTTRDTRGKFFMEWKLTALLLYVYSFFLFSLFSFCIRIFSVCNLVPISNMGVSNYSPRNAIIVNIQTQ